MPPKLRMHELDGSPFSFAKTPNETMPITRTKQRQIPAPLTYRTFYTIIASVMAEYRERIADEIIKEKLSYMGAVLVRGAKWCGKTTTCEQLAKSALYMEDP